MIPDHLTPLPDKPRGTKPRNISDDQAVELLDAYTQTDEPIKDLSARFGIKETYIYNVLQRAGVDWRRGNPESFMEWQAAQARKQDSVPEPVAKAIENMLDTDHVLSADAAARRADAFDRVGTARQLPPKPEPVAPTPAIERRRVHITGSEPLWEVTVQGIVQLHGNEIEDVLIQCRQNYPQLRVTGIRQLT